MRTMRAILAAGALLGTAACAPMQWVKEDATPAQFQQDSVECQQDAWREARMRYWYYQPFGPWAFHDPIGRRFFGWPGPWADPFGDPYLEEGRLAQFCMRAKGYRLVPAEPKK